MYVSVLVRKLKPGKTVDDFVRAWYPEKGFGIGHEFDFSTDQTVARGRPPGLTT
jgi:hypothetical protein